MHKTSCYHANIVIEMFLYIQYIYLCTHTQRYKELILR